MIFNSNEVCIGLDQRETHKCLRFEFKGRFTEAASKKACEAWTTEFEKGPNEYILIWDCLQMEGFEISAKNEWVKVMNLLSEQIIKVIVVSDSMVIRGASHLMLKLFPFKSQVVRSLEKHY